jgi:hypothetical protein
MKNLKMLLLVIILFYSTSVTAQITSTEYELTGENVMGREMTTTFNYTVAQQDPVQVSFVIDDTASMGGEIDDIKNNIKSFFEDLGSDAEGSIVTFKDSAQKDQSFTTNEQTLESAVDSISADGGGDCEEDASGGLSLSKDNLNWKSERTKVVILVLGSGFHDPDRIRNLADEFANKGYQVYTVTDGLSCNSDSDADAVHEYLPDQTGGRNYRFGTDWSQIFNDINEDTSEGRSADLHAIMPSHTHSFNKDPDSIRDDGRREYIFNDINVKGGTHSIKFNWFPTNYGSNLEMKTGESYIDFTEDGDTTEYNFDQTENSEVEYVDFNVYDSHAVRDVSQGEIDLEVKVRNDGNTESRETDFRIYDESGNSIDETLPPLSAGETHTYSYTLEEDHRVYDDSEMIKAKADVTGRWGDDGKELEPDEENNIKKLGYPIDPNVQNPTVIDYNYPRTDTRFGEDLIEEIQHQHPDTPELYGHYDLWVGANEFEPENGQPELRHDNRSYGSTGVPIETQPEEVDRAETYWNFTNRVNDTYGSMSVFNHSVYIKNPIPEVIEHRPDNQGFETEYPVPVNVIATDDNDQEVTFYLFNRSDDTLLQKETIVGIGAEDDSAQTTYDWEVPEAHSEYTLGLVVEDRWDNYTEDIEYMKIIGQGFALEGGFDHDYTSVILSGSSSRNVLFTAKNTRPFERDINLTLSGVNARFNDGSNYTYTTFGPEEEKEFLLTVNPYEENTGQRYLNVTMDYPDIRYNKTESMPVFVRDIPAVGNSKEVPGIGNLQLFMLVLSAVYLYSVRL